MDFIEKLQALSAKIQKQKDFVQTEEATKQAFVLPFLSALGYEVSDPMEVVPEFTADAGLLGIKKGEKVDYAIMRDGKVIMLFECKAAHVNLAEEHASQLFGYFIATEARIAVLTDGIIYRFYSDIELSHKMDTAPFMEFNMLNIQEYLVPELKRLTKQAFNLDEIILVAGEMKYSREIKRILGEELDAPTEDFVKFFARRVYKGILTQSVRGLFTTITKKSFTQFINETINERLKLVMTPPAKDVSAQTQGAGNQGAAVEAETQEGIVTTPEELEGFYIVKSILRQVTDPARITYRDKKGYFGILLDNNQLKPICRLHVDGKQKFLSLFSQEKQWEKVPIEKIDDLYKYADRLNATVAMYDNPAITPG
jgi:hypothetical protein